MSRILVVGDVVDDIVVRPSSNVTAASDTNARIQMVPGGSAANVAAWLGWLGADVVFVGRAGDAGVERHREALEAVGVDARIAADPDHATGTIVLTLDESGERTMYVDRGANTSLVLPDVPDSTWDGVAWLHLTGYSFFDDAVRPTALALVRTARARGVAVSVDPSSVAFLRDCGASRFGAWIAGVDVVFPNEDEGRELSGESDPAGIASRLASSYGLVVLTLGANGAIAAGSDGWVAGESTATNVVDATGAGDAYCAGFLHAWTRGADRATSLRSGDEAAATAVSLVGARPPS